MTQVKIIDGNTAVVEAMRQIDLDVVAGFPITPTSSVMEKFSVYVDNGELDTELILAESEHAAMSACVGVSAGGGRTMTATSSQGLELMHEVLYNASGMRLPIVLINGNRALSAPLSIHCDHSDIMAVRDTGWIILMAKDAQEAYDLTLQAFRIAEDMRVRTPIIVAMDGFQTTHTKQRVQIEDSSKVKDFVGEHKTLNPLLDVDNPVSYGGATKPDYFTECKRSQLEGLIESRKVIPEIAGEFKTQFERDYIKSGEDYMLDDADFVFVLMGSMYGTVKEGVDMLREKGIKVGVLRLRTFRPFPAQYIQEKLANKKNIAVFDRTFSAGANGAPLFTEIRNALYARSNAKVVPFTVGLGGRDIFPEDLEECIGLFDKEIDYMESYWLRLR
jgi:pyruvate ferredoxin oxidoreductase alpha subunit